MNKILLIISLFLAPLADFSQARLVINGTSAVTVVESGGTSTTPIYIEIANSASNAISTLGQNGWIQSESEFNMVKWDIGTTSGTDTVPFGYGTSYKLPLVVTLNGASASGSGSILFSTFHCASQDKWTAGEYPTDVTNMHAMYATNGLPSATDNSENAADRFWIIDAHKFPYTTKPVASSITFHYIHGTQANGASGGVSPDEFSSPDNYQKESYLVAQRFNPASATYGGTSAGWGDWLGSGTQSVNTTTGVGTVVNTNSVSAANFYRSWIIVNSNDPLPINLSSFTAQCDNTSALIQWTTQTENENAYFTLKKTSDGIHFAIVDTIKSKSVDGNSSFPLNYSLIDNSPDAGVSYYMLYETDLDGNEYQVPGNNNPIEFTSCGDNNSPTTVMNAYNTTNYINVQINSVGAANYVISLVNMLGQVIYSGVHAVSLGNNEIMLPNNVSPGVYLLNIRNDQVNYTKKMVIGVR